MYRRDQQLPNFCANARQGRPQCRDGTVDLGMVLRKMVLVHKYGLLSVIPTVYSKQRNSCKRPQTCNPGGEALRPPGGRWTSECLWNYSRHLFHSFLAGKNSAPDAAIRLPTNIHSGSWVAV